MRRSLVPIVVAGALIPMASVAQILTAENQAELCVASFEGKPAVDKDLLAYAIVVAAGGASFLDGSNPAGFRDRAVQLQTADGVLSEPVYVMLNYGLIGDRVERNRPFGPSVDLRTNERALAVRNKIGEIVREELQFLVNDGSFPPGSTALYTTRRRPDVTGAPVLERNWKNTRHVFEYESSLVILCEPASTPTSEAVAAKAANSIASFADTVRLRGTVKDLTVKATPSDIKTAKPATVSYKRDEKADTNNFGLNGVLGVHMGDPTGAFDLLPFVSYENRAVTGNKGDVVKVSPGVLLGYKYASNEFSLYSRLEAALLEDVHQDARQAKARLYVDPAIALGNGNGILFGTYLPPIGPLQLRPELTLIGDASDVYKRGSSKELAGASDYFGLGGELSLRTRFDAGQPLSDFVLQLGVRHLSLFGDVNKNVARRWFASLEFAPQNFPYLGIRFALSKGENDDTFQNEETYGLELTLRY